MTTILLEFHPGAIGAARAAYRKSDLGLQYEKEGTPQDYSTRARVDSTFGIEPVQWLGIADTLVMVFSGSDAELVSFDAYTNSGLWEHTTELAMPEVIGTGVVRLVGPPSDTDRIDMGVVPQFWYCERQSRLRIGFGRQVAQYYRVSECLIVGVDEGTLASLELSNLRVE